MSTTTRVEQLAARFGAVNDEIIAMVEQCTDEQWRRPSESEGWPVGVVAHHVGVVNRDFARIVEKLAAGETHSPGASMDVVHESNARHARDFADVGKPETLDELRANGAALTRLLLSLDDDQLDSVAGTFGGRELSVEQVVEMIVIGHAAEHLASIRATLDG